MEIILINEEMFREFSPLKGDAEITTFIPYLNIAQKMYIERLLGGPLLAELQNQIKAAVEGGPDISPANQALLRLIAPPLALYAVYQGLPFHWASIVNKGVTVMESENSKGVALDDISQLRRWLRDDAEALKQDLVNYLCECQSSYPLWRPLPGCRAEEPGEGSAEVIPDCGIYIPRR